jgi:hypothetical protein
MTNSYNFSAADVEGVKARLIEFLQQQDKFKGFNFDGSNLNVLLDVLAYDTHYKALYDNFVLGEQFISSAIKREDIVARAYEYGYTPRSFRAPEAIIDVIMESNNGIYDPLAFYTLPYNSPFKSTVDGNSVAFYNSENAISVWDSELGKHVFKNVKVKEGTPLSITYRNGNGVRFIIPNSGCDISSIIVTVQDNASIEVSGEYVKAGNLTTLTSESRVFFVREIPAGLYEIYFGDGVISKAVTINSSITIDYITTNGVLANGIRIFDYNGPTFAGFQLEVETLSPASGGAVLESEESIRTNALNYRATQDRCVTDLDFMTLIKERFPEIKDINVWGGEDNIPAKFGSVFISAMTNEGVLPEFTKSAILDFVKTKSILGGIRKQIVDPSYINVSVNSTVRYDRSLTSLSSSGLTSNITYNINELSNGIGSYKRKLSFSNVSSVIDNSDPSIVNSNNVFLARMELPIKKDVGSIYTFDYYNPIQVADDSVYSNPFFISGLSTQVFLGCDITGNVHLYERALDGSKRVRRTVGKVNFSNGVIQVTNLSISSTVGANQSLSMFIKPDGGQIIAKNNQILNIDLAASKFNLVGV